MTSPEIVPWYPGEPTTRPSDRRTSVMINRQALPMLRDEVVQAQSANVDVISGATLTSEAFIRSIGGALQQASHR